jgi:hypothetical protein
MKDLTGVVQSDLLRQRGSPKADGAKLTALRLASNNAKRGNVWETRCECGNTREVAARDFTSGKIRKCATCVSPGRAAWIPGLNARRAEMREQFYPVSFRRTWKQHYEKFTARELLLFETIMDRRRRCPYLEMQAVDLVIRARPDIEWELDTFSDERVERAKRRLAERGIKID